jgi:hypothetical protein
MLKKEASTEQSICGHSTVEQQQCISIDIAREEEKKTASNRTLEYLKSRWLGCCWPAGRKSGLFESIPDLVSRSRVPCGA